MQDICGQKAVAARLSLQLDNVEVNILGVFFSLIHFSANIKEIDFFRDSDPSHLIYAAIFCDHLHIVK
jgi:hypothetical protein